MSSSTRLTIMLNFNKWKVAYYFFCQLALLCLVSDFLFRGDYSNALLHYEKGVTKLPEVFNQGAFNPRFLLIGN